MIETEVHRKPIKKYLEILLAAAGFIVLYLALAFFAPGGLISTDVAWYMNAGLNGIKDPFILNRYFHVFLEAIFFKITPTPMIGLQHFWAFFLAGTSLLIYISARIFSRKSKMAHGILAVSLFLSIGAIANTAGAALVDNTAMFMAILITTVYLFSVRIEHGSKWLLILLGFLFFLAFKTKETTLITGFLVIGLGFSGGNIFNPNVFFRRLVFLAAGVLAGIVFFACLSWIFLGDPFFGLRISEFLNFTGSYVSGAIEGENRLGTDSWYSGYLFGALLIPFILYLISGIRVSSDPDLNSGRKLVWLVPLGMILFVTFTVGNQWGLTPRFLFPALPVICLLGPQFLDFDFSSLTRKDHLKTWFLFCIGLVCIFLFRLLIRDFNLKSGDDIGLYLNIYFVPVLLSFLLALVFIVKQINFKASVLITLLILAIITIPLVTNYKIMFKYHPNQAQSDLVLYPFSAFADQIQYTPDMKMYVSKNTWGSLDVGNFVKDQNEIASLFNIYFDAASIKNNFTLKSNLSENPYDILSSNYTYVLLSMEEWLSLTQDLNFKLSVQQRYLQFSDDQDKIVLLKAR